MEEFLNEIGIQGKLNITDDNTGVLEILGSDNYGRIYSRLDKSNLVEEDEDSSQMTAETASIQYESEQYLITLLANFDTDEYKLVIKEN